MADFILGQAIFSRSYSGSFSKKAQLTRSCSRISSLGTMSRDLWLALLLSRAGQTSAQMPQPVQSSGATW